MYLKTSKQKIEMRHVRSLAGVPYFSWLFILIYQLPPASMTNWQLITNFTGLVLSTGVRLHRNSFPSFSLCLVIKWYHVLVTSERYFGHWHYHNTSHMNVSLEWTKLKYLSYVTMQSNFFWERQMIHYTLYFLLFVELELITSRLMSYSHTVRQVTSPLVCNPTFLAFDKWSHS